MKISNQTRSKENIHETFNVSQGLTIHGNIEGCVSGRIEGNVFGNIELRGKVIVADNAVVTGYVIGSDVVIYGSVRGNVIGFNNVAILGKAEVGGDVNCVSISIEKKAVVKGNIRKTDLITEDEISSAKVNSMPKINNLKAVTVANKEQDQDTAKEAWW